MSFPTKDERKKCWDARDRYWECLDGTPEEKNQCLELRKVYEKSCPSQWVKHFDRKRTYLQFKERIEKDGVLALSLQQAVTPQHAFRGCPPYNEIDPIVRRHQDNKLKVYDPKRFSVSKQSNSCIGMLSLQLFWIQTAQGKDRFRILKKLETTMLKEKLPTLSIMCIKSD